MPPVRSLSEVKRQSKVIDVFRTLLQYQDRKQPQGLHLVLGAYIRVVHDHENLNLQHRRFS